ncbi:MAG: hypothetical protein AB1767_13900, partial [Bacillota bacterium]
LLAGVYTALLLGPAGKLFGNLAVPAFLGTVPAGGFSFWWSRAVFMFNQFLVTCGILLVAAVLFYAVRVLRLAFFFSRRRG